VTGVFQRFLGRRKPEDTEVPPSRGGQEKTEPVHAPVPELIGPAQFLVGCAQSIGKKRDHNEDALFTMTVTLSVDGTRLPFGVYIVADGMGGHMYGEIASGIATRSVGSYLVAKLCPALMYAAGDLPDETIQSLMAAGIQEAHQAVLEEAPGGGTTLTAMVVLGDSVTIAHVGDSRAYEVGRDGSMKALTRDHSLVKRLVELGQITNEEASIHPQRNVLYRALGQSEPVEADLFTVRPKDAGFLLLCSDGLWGVVKEEAIAEIIRTFSDPKQACQRMIEAANANGGPDNITAILIRLPE
jgi:serine/threonine protein phosphatase PrpC